MNFTDDYANINDLYLTKNCRNIENNIDLNLPIFLLTLSCHLSFFYVMSLMVYTLIKPLFNNK